MYLFRLHQLPRKYFLNVVKTMDIHDILTYSLCSKNTKENVKSLKLKVKEIKLEIDEFVALELYFGNTLTSWSCMRHNNHFPNKEFVTSEPIEVRFFSYRDRTDWKVHGFEIMEYIHHFCEILHHQTIDGLLFSGDRLDVNIIEPIQKVIKGFHLVRLSLCDQLTNEFKQNALESFPDYDKLYLTDFPFERNDFGGIEKILMQNLKRLIISESQLITLNQLLPINSQDIQLHESVLREKDFNTFLRLWILGSHSKLKYLYAVIPFRNGFDALDKDRTMKGIKYIQIPIDSEEVHRRWTSVDWFNETKLSGGYRIKRFDSTEAVVLIESCSFNFIVY